MPLTLVQLELPQLEALQTDPTQLDGIPVVGGALPPPFILDGAASALKEGSLPLWFSPFLFVEGSLPRAVGSGGFKGAPGQRTRRDWIRSRRRVPRQGHRHPSRQRTGQARVSSGECRRSVCGDGFGQQTLTESRREGRISPYRPARFRGRWGCLSMAARQVTARNGQLQPLELHLHCGHSIVILAHLDRARRQLGNVGDSCCRVGGPAPA